jgi:hypothetical protein
LKGEIKSWKQGKQSQKRLRSRGRVQKRSGDFLKRMPPWPNLAELSAHPW